MKPYSVYKITNTVNGKVYIGLTGRTVDQRFKQHKHTSKNKPQYALYSAMNKHGFDAFVVDTIATGLSYKDACAREIALIKDYNSFGRSGYNMTKGGDGVTVGNVSDETRMKMSIARKGVPKPDEHKRKIGLAHKGMPKPKSEEAMKYYIAKRGVPQSKERAEKSRKALLIAKKKWAGSTHTQESKDKMVAAKSRLITIEIGGESVTKNTTLAAIARDGNISRVAICKAVAAGRRIKKKESSLFGALVSYA